MNKPSLALHVCLATLILGSIARGQDQPAELAQIETALAASPRSISLLSAAGDAYLFLGQFDKAVDRFGKMIDVDPAQDAKHWRLGIAYYFNRQYEESSKQFAKYHEYAGRDRENGLWKFLADAKAHGLERARAEMLVYKQFDREPFPNLYELYAGRLTPEQFDADLTARKLTGDPRVMFFAHYYRGLFEELLGHEESAR